METGRGLKIKATLCPAFTIIRKCVNLGLLGHMGAGSGAKGIQKGVATYY
jgi:hypothetical protein